MALYDPHLEAISTIRNEINARSSPQKSGDPLSTISPPHPGHSLIESMCRSTRSTSVSNPSTVISGGEPDQLLEHHLRVNFASAGQLTLRRQPFSLATSINHASDSFSDPRSQISSPALNTIPTIMWSPTDRCSGLTRSLSPFPYSDRWNSSARATAIFQVASAKMTPPEISLAPSSDNQKTMSPLRPHTPRPTAP